MKKYSYISMLAIAAMAAFSCSKALEAEVETIVEDETTNVVKEPLVITAYSDDDIAPDTKTSLDVVSVLWADTDAVAAYKSGDVNPYASTGTSVTPDGKKATFTFEDLTVGTDVTYLIYPNSAAGKESTGTFAISLPSEQAATEDSFADGANLAIADGSVSADAVQFKNIGALIGFSISNNNVASVEISANEAMTGAAVVTPGSPVAPTVAKSGLTYVELTGGITKDAQYYAVVYPGTYTGLTIKVTDTDGKLATYTNPNSLVLDRNANKQIADLTVAADKWKTLKRTSWSHTFTAKAFSSNGSQTISGKSWTLAGEGGYWGYEAARGQQFGSGSSPYRNLTLTSNFGVDEGIDEITVNASTGGTASIAVSVGGHIFECSGSSSANLTSTNAAYRFQSPDGKVRTGNIVISIKQPSSSKANYIKSIVINSKYLTTSPANGETIEWDADESGVSKAETITVSQNYGASGYTVSYTDSGDDWSVSDNTAGAITVYPIADNDSNTTDKTLTITITHKDDGEITSVITLKQNKIGGTSWTRVTSMATLLEGGTFIMGYEASAKSGVIIPLRSKDSSATTSANGYFNSGTTNGSSTSGTIDMSDLSEVNTSDFEVYITESSTDDYINIQRVNDSGNYYGSSSGGSSKNTARLYTSGNSNETNLLPEWASEENNQFKLSANVSGSYKYLKYNTGSPRFAFYDNAGEKIVFYKKN